MVLKRVGDVGGKFKVPLEDDQGTTMARLLWGDPVRVLQTQGGKAKVRARGMTRVGTGRRAR
jgi:hypothetical protein